MNPRQSTRERLLGSRWRDKYGNEYWVSGVSGSDGHDPELSLKYIPPAHQRLPLSEVNSSFTLIEEGYDRGCS